MDFIRVSEMLDIMQKKGEDGLPIPFNMRFVTCNIRKNTGGKRITCTNVVLVGGAMTTSTVKDQAHFKNFTRNFRSVNNVEVRQFHPLLVEEFNNLKVVL